MNYLPPAQAGAQLFSLIVFAAISGWYVVPWLNRQARARQNLADRPVAETLACVCARASPVS